jgi:hypothetical protein
MMTTNRKKSRLRLILIVAMTIGCSSATMSGTLAAFSAQHAGPGVRALLA